MCVCVSFWCKIGVKSFRFNTHPKVSRSKLSRELRSYENLILGLRDETEGSGCFNLGRNPRSNGTREREEFREARRTEERQGASEVRVRWILVAGLHAEQVSRGRIDRGGREVPSRVYGKQDSS